MVSDIRSDLLPGRSPPDRLIWSPCGSIKRGYFFDKCLQSIRSLGSGSEGQKNPKTKGKKAVKLYFITLFEAALTGQFIERKAAKSFLFSDHFSSTNVKNVLRAAVFKCQDLLLLFSSGAAKLGGAAPGLWSGGGPNFQTPDTASDRCSVSALSILVARCEERWPGWEWVESCGVTAQLLINT